MFVPPAPGAAQAPPPTLDDEAVDRLLDNERRLDAAFWSGLQDPCPSSPAGPAVASSPPRQRAHDSAVPDAENTLPQPRGLRSPLSELKFASSGSTRAVIGGGAALETDVVGECVVLFPGAGGSSVGMGRTLLHVAGVPELFERASRLVGFDVLKTCLRGPDELLLQVGGRHAEVCAFVVSLAAMLRLSAESPQAVRGCVAAAGYGTGEVAALVFGGVLSFDDGVRLVKTWADAVADVVAADSSARAATGGGEGGAAAAGGGGGGESGGGGMITLVGLDDATLAQLVSDGRRALGATQAVKAAKAGGGSPAAAAAQPGGPAPEAVVSAHLFPRGRSLSGDVALLEWLLQHAPERGALFCRRLATTGAFNSPRMARAQASVAACLAGMPMRPPAFSLYSCVAGRPYADAEEVRSLLPRQLCEPLLWEESMRHLLGQQQRQQPPRTCYEAGPGKLLRAMMRRIDMQAWKATRCCADGSE